MNIIQNYCKQFQGKLISIIKYFKHRKIDLF